MPRWTPKQEEAIYTSGSNIIVSAGAGSGKTAVLSERVLEKLKNGIHVNELLVLTFTKAAAAEMKDRIRKKITKVPELKEELNLLNSSYITTFDSFALSVVKKYHYLLNVSKDISISEESIINLTSKKIIDEIFENEYIEKNKDFLELIKKYCNKNDDYFRKLILELCIKIDNFLDKNEYINKIKNYFYSDEFLNKIFNEYDRLIDEKRKLIKFELNNLSYYLDSDKYLKYEESVNYMLNCDYSDIHTITKPETIVLRGADEETKVARDNLNKAINELLDIASLGSKEIIREDILSTKKYVLAITNIIEKYIKKLRDYKDKNNIYTFSDIAYYAIKVISENENARNELKYSFKEIMIDEYQDTNDVQDTFIKLIENNNVYMVGDIKQSIYRFRGSNPNIFKEKYDNYSNNNGGVKIDLIQNFRSRSEVLNDINRLFELIMDDNIGGASYKESHEMVYGNTLYDEKRIDTSYNLECLEYKAPEKSKFSDIEIEIFTIANDIKNKIHSGYKVFDKETSELRDAKYSDFVIILDRKANFANYKKVFEYLGIPLTILDDEELNSNTDMLLIKNMLDIVNRINNNDFGIDFKYDYISIARSFLYEYDDKYIFNVFKNNSFKETKLYTDFSSIDSINSKTSEMVLNEILDITDFYNKIYKVGDYENSNTRINNIYNLASNLSSSEYTLSDFIDYLTEINKSDIKIKYKSFSDDIDSVKILTIHASKGLEYPVCYFADMNHKFNDIDTKSSFLISKNYGLIIPSMIDAEDTKTTLLKELFKNNFYREEIAEKIRLFYVALTRAREKMIVVIPSKECTKYEKDNNGVIDEVRRINIRKLSEFIYYVKEYLPEYFSNVNIDDIKLTKEYLNIKNSSNKLEKNKEKLNVKEIHITNDIIEENHFSKETVDLIDKETDSKMKYGTKIHEIFELIDFKKYDEKIIDDLFIRKKVTKFLNNELLKNVKDANIYHEYEFEYEIDSTKYHGIIDLMLEYQDNIDIIDFKLKNVEDTNYLKQLNGYKKYIESISNKKINIYLYSIIDEEITKLN